MPNYFFTDENGTKHLLTEQRLQTLVERGVIVPTTPLETEDGHQGFAGQIPRLNFNNVVPPKVEQTTYYSPPRHSAVYSQQSENSVGGSIMSWLFDFAFQDLRLPVINLWACRIVYVICIVAAILWAIWMTIMFFTFTISSPTDFLIVLFIATPLTWLGAILFILFSRLLCEWYIIVFDWIIETTKAARKYNDE